MLAALLQHTGRAKNQTLERTHYVSLLLEGAHFDPLCYGDTKRHMVCRALMSVTAQFTVPQYLIDRSQASRLTARRVAVYTCWQVASVSLLLIYIVLLGWLPCRALADDLYAPSPVLPLPSFFLDLF